MIVVIGSQNVVTAMNCHSTNFDVAVVNAVVATAVKVVAVVVDAVAVVVVEGVFLEHKLT